MNKKSYIKLANKAATIQINELKKIKKIFNSSFVKAVEAIMNCKGKVIFSGVGKNSFICKKAAATFSSVGIPSFFVDPTGVSHGDAGQLEKRDILIIISNSGNTSELLNLLKFANRFRIKIIGIASNSNSMLIKASDIKILYPKLKEADPNNIVPTSSTSFVMLLCDCLATTIMEKRKFSKENFFLYHKGGNLGAALRLAKDIMVTGKKMPVINFKKSFKEALRIMNQKRLGIIVVTKNKYIKECVPKTEIVHKKKVLSKTALSSIKIPPPPTKPPPRLPLDQRIIQHAKKKGDRRSQIECREGLNCWRNKQGICSYRHTTTIETEV